MRITISAGHGIGSRAPGGYDSGAVGGGVHEATRVLALAKNLAYDFAALGWHTFLRDRGYYARADDEAYGFDSDVFCELHLNSGTARASGVEVLVNPSAGKLTRAVAASVSARIAHALEVPNRGVKERGDLAVLKPHGEMRSILVEAYFVSNRRDRDLGRIRAYRVERAIMNGILTGLGFKAIGGLVAAPRLWSKRGRKFLRPDKIV